MKQLYTLLIVPFFLNAQTVDEMIQQSFIHNYQLQILQEEAKIKDKQAEIDGTWDDPVLNLGVNDIQFEKPLSRDIEAMQNQYIAISQTIPLSNRLEVAANLQKEQKEVLIKQQTLLKSSIASQIRKNFIDVQYAKQNLAILDEYIAFLQTPMRLLVNLSAVEKNSVEQYIQTQLLQKRYQLQREKWLETIAVAKEQVEFIANTPIDDFSDQVKLEAYFYKNLATLHSQLEEQNPELHVIEALKKAATQGVALAEAKEQADLTLSGGYYQRVDRNDYVSLSVSYPLFIHDKQSNQKVQAVKRAGIQALSYEKRKIELQQELKIALHRLESLNQTLAILQQSEQNIRQLIANAKAELAGSGSLIRHYQLFTQQTDNRLEQNQKRYEIALQQNQIAQLLGVIE